MNCATHSDTAAVAFCRTCGKPLCQNCTRDVRGVIYCESCLAARLDGTAPAAAFVPPAGFVPPAQTVFPPAGTVPGMRAPVSSGPNPAVAGILAGFFPIGVGAVYTGQYAKGLAHLVISVLMIMGVSSDEVPWQVKTILGISMGFFYVYQIIDAIRSAKALQTGEPAPDPFGLGQIFGAGETFDGAKVPAGSAVLIGLGVLFLLHTVGIFTFSIDRFWPLILIFLGVWLFAKQWGLIGGRTTACPCERCRTKKVMGPAILVTLGVVFLIGFWHAWPALLLVIGVVKLMQSNASSEGHFGPFPPGTLRTGIPGIPGVPPAAPPAPSATPNPGPSASSGSGEVNNNV